MENNDQEQTTVPAPASGGDSTPAPATTSTPAPAPTSTSTAAPAAGDQNQPASALDAALAALKKIDGNTATPAADAAAAGTTPAAKPGEQKPGATTAAPGAQQGQRLTKEQWEALPAPFRARVTGLERTVKEQAPAVKAWGDLQRWATNTGVSEDEFQFALQFISAVRNDPAEAHKMVQPVLAVLRRHVGEELPQDLAAKVDAGTLSKEDAQALAATRAENARLQSQGRQREQRDADQVAVARYRAQVSEHQQALAAYESRWKGSDPDYSKKSQRTWERMAAIMQKEGRPQTAQQAVAILARARADVENWMKGFLPPPKAKEALPAGGTGAQTRTEPQNALEAARLGLARYQKLQAKAA